MKTNVKTNRKLTRMLRRPYIQNRITFTSELYPNANSSKSIVTAGASGSFSIRLMPLLSCLGAAAIVLMIMTKSKLKK